MWKPTADQRRAAITVTGFGIGIAGVGVSYASGSHAPGTGWELLVLVSLAIVAGAALSFVQPSRVGAPIVVNPAVCFTFAILLSWGLLASLAAHVAALSVLAWRHRLPPGVILRLVAQVAVAFAAATAVLHLDGAHGPRGRAWTQPHDAVAVIGAMATWLIAYMAIALVLFWLDTRRTGGQIPPPTTTGLLFIGSLLVLSPVVAITADTAAGLAVLVLVPLYTVQRMARLAIERDRADRVDLLTSVGNRLGLRESFDTQLTSRARNAAASGGLALVLLGLDRFKYINDSLGFEVGDQVLAAVATRLTKVGNAQATVARLGADVFAVLDRVRDSDAARVLAMRAVEATREPVRIDGLLVDVNASAGVVSRSFKAGQDFPAFVRHAEAAMYDAKRHGNGVSVYRDQLGLDSPDSFALLSDFRAVLVSGDRDQLSMHYQPQVNINTGTVEGLEALLRWRHPVRGPIDTATIIGLAEHSTVMHLLTERVIDNVTARLAAWHEEGLNPRVAINVSARDLYSQSIVTHLKRRLDEFQLPAHQFQIEVTESALVADPARAGIILRRISELGIDISLDDFGTGYSSFQYLRQMPLNEIKVDQSFVSGMTRHRDDASIVSSTIELAHSLGLRTVAEGVEDQPTLQLLGQLECDLGQGYHISRAVPEDKVPDLIANRLGRAA